MHAAGTKKLAGRGWPFRSFGARRPKILPCDCPTSSKEEDDQLAQSYPPSRLLRSSSRVSQRWDFSSAGNIPFDSEKAVSHSGERTRRWSSSSMNQSPAISSKEVESRVEPEVQVQDAATAHSETECSKPLEPKLLCVDEDHSQATGVKLEEIVAESTTDGAAIKRHHHEKAPHNGGGLPSRHSLKALAEVMELQPSVSPVNNAETGQRSSELLLAEDLGMLLMNDMNTFTDNAAAMNKYLFQMETTKYKRFRGERQQYHCFMRILQDFIKPNSPREINILSKDRDQILRLSQLELSEWIKMPISLRDEIFDSIVVHENSIGSSQAPCNADAPCNWYL